MSRKVSDSNGKVQKPAKPYKDFPLFPHATKRWAKKIRGRLHYFGKWNDWKGALEKYNRERDYLHAGEEPPAADEEACTVKDLCNRFLTRKDELRRAGELSERSFYDYFRSAERLAKILGKTKRLDCLKVADFERLRAKLSSTLGPVSLSNELTRVRIILRYAFSAELIDKPLRYEEALAKPKRKTLRKAKRTNGKPMHFEVEECRRILEAATGPMRAMVLLALNTGCNGGEIGQLTLDDIDLKNGWLDYPRPKTQVDRKAKLWDETIEAVREAIERRPTPKRPEDERLVFLTQHGQSWYTDSTASPLSREFRKLQRCAGVYVEGRGFKGLRHSYRTVADETLDAAAIDLTMGHADSSMGANYRQRIDARRLEAIAEYVHDAIFGRKPE